jgi:hypothetical protein
MCKTSESRSKNPKACDRGCILDATASIPTKKAARSTRGDIASPFARGSPLWIILWRDYELYVADLNSPRETQRVESTSIRDSSLTPHPPFRYSSLTSHSKVLGSESDDQCGPAHRQFFVLSTVSSIFSTSPNSMYSTYTWFLHYRSKDSPVLPSLPFQSSF